MGVLIFGLIVLMYGSRFARRRIRQRKRQMADAPARCKCGYPIDRLDLPRCPECGRVFGFDSTAEELGLSRDELACIQSARLRRQGGGR